MQVFFGSKTLLLMSAGKELVWQTWDNVYIVYQASSAETHLFNETTELILKSLKHQPLTREELNNCVVASLGITGSELLAEDMEFAVSRLVELGIIDWSADVETGP